jgi:hypothetical protein
VYPVVENLVRFRCLGVERSAAHIVDTPSAATVA